MNKPLRRVISAALALSLSVTLAVNAYAEEIEKVHKQAAVSTETEQQRNELKKAEEHGKEKVEEVAKDISTDINNTENTEETTEKTTEGTTDIVIEMPDKKESHDGEISDTAVNEMTSTTEKIGKSIYHRRKLNVKA